MAVRDAEAAEDLHRAVDHLLRFFRGVQLGHARFAADAGAEHVLGPRRAVDQQGRGIDRERHVGEPGAGELQIGERLAEQLAGRRVPNRLVKRAAGKPQRRRADRRAEHVERRHRDLEAFAWRAQQVLGRHLGAVERKRADRMRRHQVDHLRDLESGRSRLDHECRQALGARCLAGAGEHDVKVGDAGIGDPGLGPVEAPLVAIAAGRRGKCGDVGAGLGFGQSERRDARALGHRRQPTALLLGRAEQADRTGAEPLHGEGEVGKAGMPRQHLAADAQAARIELAVGGRGAAAGGGGEEAVLPHRGCQLAYMRRRCRARSRLLVEQDGVGGRPRLDAIVQRAVLRLQERPGEEAAVGHQLPSNTGFCLATNAR